MARLLTQLGVDKARPRGRRYELPDGPGGVPGFALRVGETGVKSFVVRYRVGGQQRRVTLGPASIMSLAEARGRARKLVDQARAGVDPAEAKRSRQQGTVASIVEEYAERHLRRNLRTAHWTEQRLRRDVVSAWGARPLASITKADVVRLIDGIHDRAPTSANRTLQVLKAFLSWCVKRSLLDVNVAAGVGLPHRERARERTLSEDELRAIWPAFEAMGWPFGTLGRLLLLSGARRSEWAAATWDEVDLDRQLWRLPSGRSKTAEEIVRPLTLAAIAILETVPRIDGSPLIFPGRVHSDRPVAGFSRALRTMHRLSGTSGWQLHDLRRVVRSNLDRLGVRPDIAERVLGHVVGRKIERTYNTYRAEPEVRAALLLWESDLLERIIGGVERKVVPLAGELAKRIGSS